ncbi:ABC transporter substrate-binding protein [Ursidibacter arcticus]
MKYYRQAVTLYSFFAIFSLNPTAYSAPSIPQALLNNSVVYCTDGSDFSFNPQRAEVGSNMNIVTEQLYDKLIEFDPVTNKLKPALAERFVVSDDGLTITFYLRKNVSFHHTPWFTPTRKLNAEDVVFSLNRMMAREFELPELSAEQQTTLARYRINSEIAERTYFPYFESVGLKHRIQAITAQNSHTVTIKLATADNSLLHHLASQYAVILSKEYALQLNADENLAQLNRFPIGTGVYKVERYVQDDHVRLIPNPHYWGKKAHIGNMIVDFSTTATGRMAKFLNKECDIAAFPEPSQLSVLADKQAIIQSDGANLAYLAFNFRQEKMQDVAFRQQIAQAIDRKRLAKLLFYSMADVAENVLPKAIFPETNPDGYLYPNIVRKKLAETDRLNLWVVDEKKVYNPHPLKMAELIRADLAKVGITVKVRQVSRAYLVQQLENNQADYDLILGGWLANNFDADGFLSPILSCNAQNAVTNLSNWCDHDFDALLQSARLSEDHFVQRLLYRQAQELLQQQLPILPLVNTKRVLLVSPKVAKVNISHFGQVKLADIYLKVLPAH